MADIVRALALMAMSGAVLAPGRRRGTFAVFPSGDRRRRPRAYLSTTEVRWLESEGAIASDGAGGFAITDAGRARMRREASTLDDAFIAQHRAIEPRHVVDDDAVVRTVRAVTQSSVIARLGRLKDHKGRPWLDNDELRAAHLLRADWEAQQQGLLRGSDWSAAPQGSSARGPGNAQERRLAERCDRRKRFAQAMDGLAPPLWRVLHAVCLREQVLEALERAEDWPARSAKVALKMGLAQLAAIYAASRAAA